MTSDSNSVRKPAPRSSLLPGMAAIAIYMLIVAMVGGFGALNGRYPGGRYVILPVCTLVVVGVFGFLRLRRWGWALLTGAALSLALWIIYISRIIHNPGLLVIAGFNFCLFLYLSRPEFRERFR